MLERSSLRQQNYLSGLFTAVCIGPEHKLALSLKSIILWTRSCGRLWFGIRNSSILVLGPWRRRRNWWRLIIQRFSIQASPRSRKWVELGFSFSRGFFFCKRRNKSVSLDNRKVLIMTLNCISAMYTWPSTRITHCYSNIFKSQQKFEN